jgi:hypothetical protein
MSDVGLRFSITATGRSSGYVAQTSFLGLTLNTAGISTDKEDYLPGETVVVSLGPIASVTEAIQDDYIAALEDVSAIACDPGADRATP